MIDALALACLPVLPGRPGWRAAVLTALQVVSSAASVLALGWAAWDAAAALRAVFRAAGRLAAAAWLAALFEGAVVWLALLAAARDVVGVVVRADVFRADLALGALAAPFPRWTPLPPLPLTS